MSEISVTINKKNLNKIVGYAQAAYDEHRSEIGGMAVCIKGEDNEWKIEDPVILKQEITGTNCSLDKEKLAEYYVNTAAKKKYKNKIWRFLWWHSHHMMDAFWSGTDLNAINEYSDGDLSFALVVNLKGDYLVRVSAWDLGIYQDMDLTIINTNVSVSKKITEEVNELCNARTYVNKYSGNVNQLAIMNLNDSKTKLSKDEEKFTEIWLELNESMDEKISEAVSGEITIENLRNKFALWNGKLSTAKAGIRIDYSRMVGIDDLLVVQSYDLIEVDKKYTLIHDDLLLDAKDAYSYNWSYGLNRRYN
jgi:proteasome lid subunit RPN8/RPN11